MIILEQIKDVKRFDYSKEDVDLYSKFFIKNTFKHDYGNSLTYFTQAARNGWYFYHNAKEEILITITKKGTKGKNSPFVLVYPIGNDIDKLAKECEELAKRILEVTNTKKVILKKVYEEFINHFERYNFRKYRKWDYWQKKYPEDDDTEPEFIVDLEEMFAENKKIKQSDLKILETKNLEVLSQENKKLFKKTLRFYKKDIELENWEVAFKRINNNEQKIKEIKNLIVKWAEDRQKRYPKETKKELTEPHFCFLKNLGKNKLKNSTSHEKMPCSFILKNVRTNEVYGFSYLDKIGEKAFGIYAEIALTKIKGEKVVYNEEFKKSKIYKIGKFIIVTPINFIERHFRSLTNFLKKLAIYEMFTKGIEKTHIIKGIPETLLYHTLGEAFKMGYRYANFGGSETRGLTKFRKSLFPNYSEQQMRHLVYYKKGYWNKSLIVILKKIFKIKI